MKLVLCVLLIFILFTSLAIFYFAEHFNSPPQNETHHQMPRTFRVDFENDQFLKDGKPFQFVAGQIDYTRAVPKKWRHVLRTMRAAGLTVVSTYVPWSTHNPHDGQYVWTGMANVEEFIRLAAEEDLLVILRTSPYICSERSWVCIC